MKEKTKKDPPEKNTKEYYKSVKLPIKHILKNPDINLPKIMDAVQRSNSIVIHTLQFIKLYSFHQYENDKTLPVIDKTFINTVMKTLCRESSTGRPAKCDIQTLKKKLKTFYDKYYQKTLYKDETLDYKYLNTVLDYLTIDILTMYENNIKLHFVEYVERFVNVVWRKKFISDKIRKIKKTKRERIDAIHTLNSECRKIKNDLLNVNREKKTSHSRYHDWITDIKKHILPIKTFEKDSVRYDLQCKPFDYLPCMAYMMKDIEKDDFSIYNIFPLRSDIVPKHIRLDTTSIVHLLLSKKYGNKTDFLFKGNLKRREDDIWNFFFRTERSVFNKNGYGFHHMIETDGLSCSLLYLREDKIGKKRLKPQKQPPEQYIDELTDYKSLQNKRIVGIDPGKCDLIYCIDGNTKTSTKFRYSMDQRRKETKSKKYAKIILEIKNTKINGKTVIEYETELSKYNRKTTLFKTFQTYIVEKNKLNGIVSEIYNREIFRKLKLNGYINRKKSEQKLLTRFEKQFGNIRDTIIAFGDYEQKRHMKYKEPTKGKGMRTLFRKHGYGTYLVNEFRTSCRCSNCGNECKKFMIRENPKPFKSNLRLVHGLLRCKNECSVWNRDCNGAINIYKIAYNSINKKARPNYLCRS
jgi:hypothetical protein